MTDTQTPAPAARTRAPAAEAAPAVEAPKAKAVVKGLTAELMRGENYAIRHGGKTYRFKRGVPLDNLPESLREVLEDAADESTITDGDGGTETLKRPKFKLS